MERMRNHRILDPLRSSRRVNWDMDLKILC
jgi:hypothetical protein